MRSIIAAASLAFLAVASGCSSPSSQLKPVEFGKGDDAAAWLSRCIPPERDTSSANETPRPPIVTRFLDYPSRGVRVILTPVAALDSPPPYSRWQLMGVTDLNTNQPITPSQALARMGQACRRG